MGTIKVKLKNGTVTLDPAAHEVKPGLEQLRWQRHPSSDSFTFGSPAVNFDSSAPIIGISSGGTTASATDINANSGESDETYAYRLNLVDEGGNQITYAALTPTDPVIRNKPGAP
jgi:hypothetical protein